MTESISALSSGEFGIYLIYELEKKIAFLRISDDSKITNGFRNGKSGIRPRADAAL